MRTTVCCLKLILLFSVVSFNTTFGQIHYSKHYTMRDGLPSNSIRVIFKDSRGIMWIGTDAGLCTFDGNSFRKFSLLNENKSNKVWTITEDDYGNIWFGTYGSGLFKYNGKKIDRYQSPIIPSNHIRKIHYSKTHKCLLIGTEQGFCVYKDSIFKNYPIDPNKPDKRVQVMGFSETEKGVNFYTYLHFAYTYYPNENKIIPIPTDSPINSESSSSCFISSKGDTLVGDFKRGLKIINNSGVKRYDGMGQIFDMQEDKAGVIWVAAWSYMDMPEKGGFYCIQENKQPLQVNSQFKINDRLAWCIYIDENDNKYLGTDDNGFYFIPNNGITYFDASFFGLNKLEIYDIDYIDENIWFTANNYLIIGKQETGFKVISSDYLLKHSKSGYPNRKNHTKTQSDILLMDIAIDSLANIWIGSNKTIFKLTQPNLPLLHYNYGTHFGQRIFVDKKGKLLAAGWHYLGIIPNIFEKWDSTCIKSLDFPTDINRVIIRADEVWFSSWANGLYCYKSGKFTTYRKNERIPNNINDICIDKQKRIVAGTNDGLVKIYEVKDTLLETHSLSDTNGIIGNSISWLFCDSNNLLWVGTNSGLNVIQLNKLYTEGKAEVQFFDQEEGFNEYNVSSIIEDKNGHLWLGGEDCLVKIEPKKLLDNQSNFGKLNLSSILINNSEYDWSKKFTTNPWTHLPIDKVVLNHDENSLVFKVNTTNIQNPNKDIYSVHLDGFDKESSIWNTKQEFTYTNLKYGNYKLVVRCKNLSTQREYEPVEFAFTIRPPWWLTWWFLLFTFTFLILFAYTFIQKRLKDARRKSKVEQRVAELKLEALKAQMNPHFIFNAFSSIQLYILKQDTKNALDYLNKFSKLIRMTLDNSTRSQVRLSEEVEFLRYYLDLEKKRVINLDYSIEISDNIEIESTNIPPMLIQPLIENSIMHGIRHLDGEGMIKISFDITNENMLLCVIEDNGIGRLKASEIYANQTRTHSSKSTLINQERIELFNSSTKHKSIQMKYTDLCYDGVSGTHVELIIDSD